MADTYFGIDFGTSNTTVGVSSMYGARLLPLEEDHRTLPSAIFFDSEHNGVHFGRAAIFRYLEGVDGRFMRALKSVLGTSLIEERTYIQRRSVTFSSIIGMFFSNLKTNIEMHVGNEVLSVVLGRPVRFVDFDDIADALAEQSLKRIAQAQGFKNIEFQYEPIAAALEYEQRVQREELVLIVDIGGGTSDFSIVRVSPERRHRHERGNDILSNDGVHVGGTDFDRLLSLRSVMPHLGFGSYTSDRKRNLPSGYFHDLATWHRINHLYKKNVLGELRQIRYEAERRDLVDRFIRIVEARLGHTVAMEVERAKIELTSKEDSTFEIGGQGEWAHFRFSRVDLDEAIQDAIETIAFTVLRTLKSAGVRSESINTIVMTGGSSMVPRLRARLLSLFPAASVAESNLLGSVGLGLALDAKNKFL